jgi:hypothetical protein
MVLYNCAFSASGQGAITIRGGRAQAGLWAYGGLYHFLAYFHIIYIATASTSGPSTPSSHERMDHDPLPKFSTL